MLHRLKPIVIPFVLVAGAAACGGGGGGELSAGEAIEQSVDETCARAHECRDTFPPDAGFEFEQIYQTSVDACVTFFSNLIDDPADVDAAVAAGTLEYDAAAARECLDFFNDLSCEEYWNTEAPAACEDTFVGQVALGEACEINLECAEGFCDDTEMVCTP